MSPSSESPLKISATINIANLHKCSLNMLSDLHEVLVADSVKREYSERQKLTYKRTKNQNHMTRC